MEGVWTNDEGRIVCDDAGLENYIRETLSKRPGAVMLKIPPIYADSSTPFKEIYDETLENEVINSALKARKVVRDGAKSTWVDHVGKMYFRSKESQSELRWYFCHMDYEGKMHCQDLGPKVRDVMYHLNNENDLKSVYNLVVSVDPSIFIWAMEEIVTSEQSCLDADDEECEFDGVSSYNIRAAIAAALEPYLEEFVEGRPSVRFLETPLFYGTFETVTKEAEAVFKESE